MSSPPIGVNVLGGIYVVIRCCGLIIFQPLQHGYIRSKEFECQSFKEFLKWKEKEEEDNNTFYAQSTGKKPFTDINNTGWYSGTSHKLNGTYASLDM